MNTNTLKTEWDQLQAAKNELEHLLDELEWWRKAEPKVPEEAICCGKPKRECDCDPNAQGKSW